MKDKITIGEKYGPAMVITSQAEADAYLQECIAHSMRKSSVGYDAVLVVERTNLAYYAGYYGAETRLRVERLFRCEHPIFGKAAAHTPTLEEAFRAGATIAKEGVEAARAIFAGYKVVPVAPPPVRRFDFDDSPSDS